MIKGIIYVITFALSLLSLFSLNIKDVFKLNKIYEARILFVLLSMALSYLATNFIYDFYLVTRIV